MKQTIVTKIANDNIVYFAAQEAVEYKNIGGILFKIATQHKVGINLSKMLDDITVEKICRKEALT